MASLFDRLDEGRPPPTKKTQEPSSAQKLLDWLQRWDKPVVRVREICIYGPRPRDRKSAIDAARILVEQGWLVPLKPHRYDSREWQIVRKPIIYPTVASVAD
jgi:hypothetical protein